MIGGVLQIMQEHIFSTVNCQLSTHRVGRGAQHKERSALPFFIIFIVIVEKKITLTVIFFSTVIGTVIGMHCNALHHDKVNG